MTTHGTNGVALVGVDEEPPLLALARTGVPA